MSEWILWSLLSFRDPAVSLSLSLWSLSRSLAHSLSHTPDSLALLSFRCGIGGIGHPVSGRRQDNNSHWKEGGAGDKAWWPGNTDGKKNEQESTRRSGVPTS